ncbi:MAG: hypothetical protein LBH37_00075 [Oscillospiraceae bacterium]|nr:hypothetical protein [Oscillospiraceae bacterium]
MEILTSQGNPECSPNPQAILRSAAAIHLKTIDLEDKIKQENKKYYLELNSSIFGMHYSIVVLEK